MNKNNQIKIENRYAWILIFPNIVKFIDIKLFARLIFIE